MTRTVSYPFARQTSANPMPVLPLVGSITVFPSTNCPFFSACSIMYLAMRSFMEPVGLVFSSFMYISRAGFGFRYLTFTSGVLPIKSKMFLVFNHVHLELLIAYAVTLIWFF